MSDIIRTIRELKNLRYLSPASDDQILEAEQRLNLKFADEFKEYLKEFGAISAKGIELTGFAASERIDIAAVTTRERKNQNIPADLYVVENIAIDGIIILQNSSGEIFELSPGSKCKKIFDSLEQYVKQLIY